MASQKPLIPYNDHNGPEMRPRMLARLEQGEAVALGQRCRHAAGLRSRLQAGARGDRAGIAVHGDARAPRAVLTGLTLAGLPSDRFLFAGFLPSRAGERAKRAGRTESRARHLDLF